MRTSVFASAARVQSESVRQAKVQPAFVDNRPTAAAQRKLAVLANNGPQAMQQKSVIDSIKVSASNAASQRKTEKEDAPLQGKFETVQRAEEEREQPTIPMKVTGGTLQLAPFNPESAAKTTPATDNPSLWAAGGTFGRLTSNGAGYPLTAGTMARDSKGGDSVTSHIQPTDMEKWRLKGMLPDPTPGKAQTLTKMHAINSHLYGPNDETNILLGSASANDKHSDEVEEPIKKYLTKGKRAVNYLVTVAYGNPGFVNPTTAYAALTAQERLDFATWNNLAIAHTVSCQAIYYQLSGANWMQSAVENHTIDALTTNYAKKGGYRKPKKPKMEKGVKKRAIRKIRNSPLYSAIVVALKAIAGPRTIATVYEYIKVHKLGKWTRAGIALLLKQMQNRNLLSQAGGSYKTNKRT